MQDFVLFCSQINTVGRKIRIVEDVQIIGIADRGKSVGKAPDGRIIFVEELVPGDIADVMLLRKRKGVFQGRPRLLKKASPDRVKPACQHFGICGGCKWQHLSYTSQLKQKNQVVYDALTRIGGISALNLLPIKGSKRQIEYRNKLEYSFSDKRWLSQEEIDSGNIFDQRNALGFHRPGTFDKIVDIEKCHLQEHLSNKIRNFVRDFTQKHDLPYFNIRAQEGLLRNMVIRNTSLGQWMLSIVFYKNDEKHIKLVLDAISSQFPQITSLYYVINQKKNDSLSDQEFILYKGKAKIEERLGETRFLLGPKSFFQTNSSQAKVLYDTLLEFAAFDGSENVYDLYSGLGSIALYIAKKVQSVVGIEEIPAAVEDARENAVLNNATNATFYFGLVRDILSPAFVQKHGKADVLITDPPRAGMHNDVISLLLEMEVAKIVYVSCNPSTQARDVKMLSEKYDLIKAQPVDMFPHTHHIENVALLKLK